MKKLLILATFFIGVAFTASAQTDTTIQPLTGKYKFAEGSPVAEVNVTIENGVLMMASSAGSSTLVKQSDDVYTVTAFQGTAVFKRNDAKKVVGVTITAMGYTLEGTKEEGGTIFQLIALKKLEVQFRLKNSGLVPCAYMLNSTSASF